MSDPRDYKLDLSERTSEPPTPPSLVGRPFLSVRYACCGAYQRIYRDRDGKTYSGRCPKCTKPVRFTVGPGGIAARCFTVY